MDNQTLLTAIAIAKQIGGGGGGGGDLPSGGSAGDLLQKTAGGCTWSDDIPTALAGKISAPANPTTGQFLSWNGSAWVAASLPLYNGGVS